MMKMHGGRRMTRGRAAALLLFMILCMAVLSVKTPAAVRVKNAEWEGNGRVEVHFRSAVEYRNLRVTVRDEAGKKHCTKNIECSKDEIEFRTSGLKAGHRYSCRISGIRRKGTSKYGSVKCFFIVPVRVHGITMKETDVNLKKGTVGFEFLESVEWKSPSVSISDGETESVVKILEKDAGKIKVKTSRLEAGKWYDWKISGIRRKDRTEYVTLTGRFQAT